MNSKPTIHPAVLETRDVFLEDGVILCVRLGEGLPIIEGCRAAGRGGLKILEVTLTTPGALDIIRTLSQDEDLVVGAGTVLSPDDVGPVAEAGGRFALSPVFDPDVVDAAHARGLLAVPGAGTPREILAAHRHGATLVKVFPAAALGGPGFLRAVRGPLPDIPLVPTSGPSAETIADYVAAGAVAVGVGKEVFTEGFTPESVEKASRRVRKAMTEARAAG
jgi:2-dehydro-3-deoxyphosphogluconate aldolase/(4S)-4-hydroxy-2-oxoglutarate aldolase